MDLSDDEKRKAVDGAIILLGFVVGFASLAFGPGRPPPRNRFANKDRLMPQSSEKRLATASIGGPTEGVKVYKSP